MCACVCDVLCVYVCVYDYVAHIKYVRNNRLDCKHTHTVWSLYLFFHSVQEVECITNFVK